MIAAKLNFCRDHGISFFAAAVCRNRELRRLKKKETKLRESLGSCVDDEAQKTAAEKRRAIFLFVASSPPPAPPSSRPPPVGKAAGRECAESRLH